MNKIEDAIKDFKNGKMVIIMDDEDRENEGDLTMAASMVTPEAINFMAKKGRGLICVAMTEEHLTKLNLPDMVRENTSFYETAFTVSVDARNGVTTGISASDRSKTISDLVAKKSKKEDFVVPGHVFPLKARSGGVLIRAGQTEAAVDLARMAELPPAGVICEIMDEDGTMMRLPKLIKFAKREKIKIITIADMINYRRRTEILVEEKVRTKIENSFGKWELALFESRVDKAEHLALIMGKVAGNKPVLVRVHSECLTGDVFGSHRCDCGEQLTAALKQISEDGNGVLVYLRQEGRGIGLRNKLKAYSLQENENMDTVEANRKLGYPPDKREYGTGSQILRSLGISKMRLLTNNPAKIKGISGHGLEIVERISLEVPPKPQNIHYLETKRDKMGHMLDLL